MWGHPFFLPKKWVFTQGGEFFIANLDNSFGLAYPENLSSIGFGLIFFGGGSPPNFAKNLILAGGWKAYIQKLATETTR